jgi:hypothetical protein
VVKVKKIWADSVWSKVIAGVILATGSAVAAYSVGWWPSIAAITSKIISLVVASTPVRNWLLAPICLLALFGIYLLLAMLYPHRTGPDWHDYREDTFFDLVWRWRYDRTGSITGLAPFCSRCDTQMLPGPAPGDNRYLPSRTGYRCGHCGNLVSTNGTHMDVEMRAYLEIDRNRRQKVGK